MDFSELSNSIKATLYSRIKNPLLGCFVLSWLACNFKMIVVLLSNWDVDKKLTYIDFVVYGCQSLAGSILSVFFDGCTVWYLYSVKFAYSVFFPAVITYIIIWHLPKLTLLAYNKTLQNTLQLRDAKNKIEKNTLLTEEEGLRIKTDMFEQKRKFDAKESAWAERRAVMETLLEERDETIRALEGKLSGVNETFYAALDVSDKTIDGADNLARAKNEVVDGQEKIIFGEAELILTNADRINNPYFARIMPHLNLKKSQLSDNEKIAEADRFIMAGCIVYLKNKAKRDELAPLFYKYTVKSEVNFDDVLYELVNRGVVQLKGVGDYKFYTVTSSSIGQDKVYLIGKIRAEIEFAEGPIAEDPTVESLNHPLISARRRAAFEV